MGKLRFDELSPEKRARIEGLLGHKDDEHNDPNKPNEPLVPLPQEFETIKDFLEELFGKDDPIFNNPSGADDDEFYRDLLGCGFVVGIVMFCLGIWGIVDWFLRVL